MSASARQTPLPQGCQPVSGLPLQTIPHTVFVRRPGMEAEGVGVYRSVFVEFDPDEAARRLAVLDGLPPVIFQTEEPTFGEDFFQSLALPPRSEPWQLLAWKSRMLWLLAGLLRQAAAGGGHSPGDDAPVRQALAYIHRHYRETVTLEQLAAAAGYSSGYFCKLFKKVTGLSPLQYVVRCRLEQAKKRMLTTRDPLETIMLEVGFHNYGYFWRMFKAVYGLPIATYMKEYRVRRAMELLRESGGSIAAIAAAVGYESQGKFTRAFKDVTGQLPTEYRREHRG